MFMDNIKDFMLFSCNLVSIEIVTRKEFSIPGKQELQTAVFVVQACRRQGLYNYLLAKLRSSLQEVATIPMKCQRTEFPVPQSSLCLSSMEGEPGPRATVLVLPGAGAIYGNLNSIYCHMGMAVYL